MTGATVLRSMEFARLGNSGLVVSRLALGSWTFAMPDSARLRSVHKVNADEAAKLIAHAIDAGVNHFDTADQYADGDAERMLGAAIGRHRPNVVISTKVGLRTGNALTRSGLSRQHILWSIDQSLARLGTDWVDLYVAHRQDTLTPLEETLVALDAVVRSGKARYLGFSNWRAWQVAAAVEIQKANGLAPFTHGQMHYSLIGRDIERDFLAMCRHFGLGLTVWSPLAMGLLSGKYDLASLKAPHTRFAELGVLSISPHRAFEVIHALLAMSKAKGMSASRIALSWLLSKRHVSSLLVGASSVDQLDENLQARGSLLSPADLDALDELSKPRDRDTDSRIGEKADPQLVEALGRFRPTSE